MTSHSLDPRPTETAAQSLGFSGEVSRVAGIADAERSQGETKHPFVCTAVAPKLAWTGWREMGKTDHFVQVYDQDVALVRSLAEFVADGIWQGDRVLVLATPEHRQGIEQRLRESGVDLASAAVTRQYLACDARALLEQVIHDGMPDPEAFEATLGAMVRRSCAGGRKVRAFGELVALLMADGKRRAAIRLEELWNALGRECAFSLYCAYPMSCFEGEGDLAEALGAICHCHSRVIPSESYAA